jgi:beta-galactosidase/beta-glucuronidase
MRVKVRVRVGVSRVTESANALPRYLVTYPRRFRRHSRQTLSTSSAYIEDITIDTESIDYDTQHLTTPAILSYSVTIAGINQLMNALQVLIQLFDANGIVVANNTDLQSRLIVNKPNLWETCGINHTHSCTEPSYLYTLQVTLYNGTSQTDVVDIYRIPHVGIRTIRLTNSKF